MTFPVFNLRRRNASQRGRIASNNIWSTEDDDGDHEGYELVEPPQPYINPQGATSDSDPSSETTGDLFFRHPSRPWMSNEPTVRVSKSTAEASAAALPLSARNEWDDRTSAEVLLASSAANKFPEPPSAGLHPSGGSEARSSAWVPKSQGLQ